MKKSFYLLLTVYLIISVPGNSQGLLKKVAKSMTNELLGKPANPNEDMPEPKCACDKPVVAMDLGGKLQLDYKELTFSILDDGSILAKTRGTEDYYIVKDGITKGPYKSGDPRVKEFEPADEDDNGIDSFIQKNKPYISRSGDKLLITFGGKTYGPYGSINNFIVSISKEKFAAIVVENLLVTEDMGKRMELEQKNAKTDQEKMDLAMKFAQEMQQKMMQGGNPVNTMPKMVSNIPDVTTDMVKTMGGSLNGSMKYDDILMLAYDKIMDLKGNTIMSIHQEAFGAEKLFVNSTNTKYAFYNYGTLTFSDKTSLPELFNPYLTKENGQVYLAYMYYSPKKNAIMQCKIVF
jgi:hypothetical protein